MEAFFAQPPVQSGLAPFVVSLVLATALWRAPARWQGLTIVGALLLAVLLIIGPTLTPLTSTRKIVIASLSLPMMALVLDVVALRWRTKVGIVILAAVFALLWVLWPVLLRRELGDAVLLAGGLALYVLVVLMAFARLSSCCARLTGAALCFAVATGVAAIMAASALYGQLAFALAAAIAGLAAVRLWRCGWGEADVDACFGLAGVMAVAVPLALLGAAASVYARLPLMALPLLALSPLLALVPFAVRWPAWLRVVIAGLLTLPASAAAIYLTWLAAGAGSSGYY
ncbi:hypothetical protein MNBD_GAMMA20-511 [hydrothermal vent metagenome]|uniref:Uncharacterized protein n=1 Tax=hydrothermal vent metagenome TaxID=652676 RepID=A0A3B1AJ73_9ZZZZ